MRRLLRNSKHGHPLGMNLVELMVTIAVIAILATLAIPSMNRSQRRAQARALATQVSQEMRAARNTAMSRSEAVWVDLEMGTGPSDRGKLIFKRTKKMCADGTIAATCSDGSTPRRARNCRMGPAATGDYEKIKEIDLQQEAGSSILRATDPAVSSICFSADGRAYDGDGVVISGGTVPCVGENLAIWVADYSAPATDAMSAATCGAPRGDRDLIDLFVIKVPYNGAIEIKQ